MILTPGDRAVLIRGQTSFLIVARAARRFPLIIDTFDDEYVQGIMPDDIIAVSAPEGGLVRPAQYLLDLVRLYDQPLLVLPKEHPGSKRLRYLLSAGPEIHLSCGIIRGTHPEQHLLCSGEDLSGGVLSGRDGSIFVENLSGVKSWSYLPNEPLDTEQQL